MAPKPPDESRETSPPPGKEPTPARPDDRRAPSRQPASDEPLDFGTFVSRSVRSSAERLRQSGSGGAAPAGESEEETPPPRSRRERSPRYWRDSVAGSPSARRSRQEGVPQEPHAEDGGDDDDGQPPFRASLFRGGDDGGPDRPLLLAVVGGIILLLLLAFLLTRLIGGGDTSDEDPTPTPTAETTEVVPGGDDAPASTPRTSPNAGQPSSTTPTPTNEVIQGGDNQLGGDRDTETEGTPGARVPIPEIQTYAQGTVDRPSLFSLTGNVG